MSNDSSISALDHWYEMIQNSSSKDHKILLLGNKLDLLYENFENNKNYNPEDEINEIDQKISLFLVNKNIFGYVKSSAKENINIQEPFIDLYNEILQTANQEYLKKSYLNSKIRKFESGDIKKHPYSTSSGCC